MTADLPAAPEFSEPVVDWHRLDVRMLIVRPLNEVLGLVPVFIGLLVLGKGETWRILLSVGMIVAIVLFGLLRWVTTRYRITAEQVEMHTGLFVRKRLAVPRERIRTVDLTAKLGHRLFGLSAIRVGTGQRDQPGEDGLTLDAVSSTEAERLRVLLLTLAVPESVEPAEERPSVVLSTLDKRWLRYAPLTLSGLVAVGALFGLTMNYARELELEVLGPLTDAAHWVVAQPLWLTLSLFAGVVLVIAGFGSVLVYIVQFGGYQLTREPDDTVRVRRGLLTTRSVSVAEQRLRGVEVEEPLLLRAGRGAHAKTVTTGLGRKGESNLLLPPAPIVEAHRVSAEVLRLEPSPTSTPLHRHPVAALRRRMVRAVVPVLVLSGVLAWFAPAWTWQVALALVPFAALLGWDRYRSLGHVLTDRYLVARQGSVVRETVALQRTGVIGWRISRSFFQRRSGLVTISATTAAGDGAYHVVDVAEGDGLALADETVPELLRPFLERVGSNAVETYPQP
ncbi:putative membrane protein [Saccharothrix tamanrassetensis]|uniref:Putative membrane protein n=1 Tax=Saccharothrix tamanrassetensis TaxID=1051531 RepID=A0A841CNE3_9PSEU|nr:PH domain-containing protein [Saccharothrix tamanrassetensis]MBB5957597.1 putative membrane protein [Saccharothrix tamanrassetensis]